MSRPESLDLIPASVDDYRELARRRLPRQVFDYLDGGAFAESTLAANVADLARVRFRQRVLVDVAERRTAVTALGTALSMPVVLAPIGFGGMMARRAEVAAARAAGRAGVAFCESTLSICSLEEVAATGTPPWFQLYVMRDRSVAEALVERAKAAGCPTLILTVDLPVVGHRYRDVRNGVSGGVPRTRSWRRALDVARHPRWVRDVALRGRPLSFGNLESVLRDETVPKDFQAWVAGQFDPSVTWADLAWLRERWPGRLALKGILDPEDARRALDHGVDGVIVSNHGGRQLDGVPSAAAALGRVADAVAGRCEVLVDGGVRSGLDVARMLALGARACLVGRAWAYAAAGGGERGVSHVLSVLRAELLVTLALTGVTDVAALDRSALVDPPF